MWERECDLDPLTLLCVVQEMSNLPLEVIVAVDMDVAAQEENGGGDIIHLHLNI